MPTDLGGSVTRIHSLDYESVRARLTMSEFGVQYIDGGEVPAQVVVDLTRIDLTGPGEVDLLASGDVSGSREMSRIPPLLSGALTLTAFGRSDGDRIAGSFTAQVGSPDRSYSVYGSFDTALEVLGPSE